MRSNTFAWYPHMADMTHISHAHRFDFYGDDFHIFCCNVIGVEVVTGTPAGNARRWRARMCRVGCAAKRRRRNTVGGLERPCERRMRLITASSALESLASRPISVPPPPAPAAAAAHDPQSSPRHRREDAMKMKTRKHATRASSSNPRLIQMLLDMRQHPQNALLIINPGVDALAVCRSFAG